MNWINSGFQHDISIDEYNIPWLCLLLIINPTYLLLSYALNIFTLLGNPSVVIASVFWFHKKNNKKTYYSFCFCLFICYCFPRSPLSLSISYSITLRYYFQFYFFFYFLSTMGFHLDFWVLFVKFMSMFLQLSKHFSYLLY